MFLILPANSLPARATTLSVTFWPAAEVAAVELADVGADFPDLEIGDLGDGHAGARRVAELERRQLHAPIHHVHVGVLLDVDVAARSWP